ncbi:MAG: acyl-CoA dehydrogenase C-terminal domain-containing protein, partial [Nocardioidaceae bacterium]
SDVDADADGDVNGDADTAFYQGKVASAQFFARNVLPKITAERAIAEATDLAPMELAEEAL